ncbi:MAG: ATP/GTP-binding protein [Microcystaceae cyanobacterium]
MITEIEIENFRCFEHTKIEGFARVNLIGGKNNSGKTALLEAILLNQSPQPKTIFLLRQLRQEPSIFSQNYPATKIWYNFFFEKNLYENKGKVIVITPEKSKQSVCFSGMLEFSEHSNNNILSSKYLEKNLTKESYDGSSLEINVHLSEEIELNKWTKKYKFSLSSHTEKINFYIHPENTNKKINPEDDSSIKDEYIDDHDFLSYLIEHFNIKLFETKPKFTPEQIIQEYSLAALDKKEDYLLKILQKIDPLIKDIRIYDIGSATLFLKKNDQFLPITMFGDAINRVTEIVLGIITNSTGNSNIILIDEIENGIHYTNHRDFWKALFELAKQLDVQIFATTHSLEMIEAFRDIGLSEEYKGDGAYFEMARNPRNDKIVGIKHNLDLLDYELRRNEGVRGE